MEAEERLVQQLGIPASLHTAAIDGTTVRYVHAGSGPPLVLLHGATVGWGQWFPNIAFFAQTFSVYALDLPGAGGSTSVDFFRADLEQNVVSVIARFLQTEGLGHATIIGHSWGAWIAVQLAGRSDLSLSRILLICPVGFSSAMPWRYRLLSNRHIVHLLTRTVMRPTRKNMHTFLQSVLAAPREIPDALAQLMSEHIAAAPERHPFFLIHRMSDFFSVRKEFLFEKGKNRVACPMLVVTGEKDSLVGQLDEANIRTLFPQANLVCLSNTGHVPALENPAAFHALVSPFLGS